MLYVKSKRRQMNRKNIQIVFDFKITNYKLIISFVYRNCRTFKPCLTTTWIKTKASMYLLMQIENFVILIHMILNMATLSLAARNQHVTCTSGKNVNYSRSRSLLASRYKKIKCRVLFEWSDVNYCAAKVTNMAVILASDENLFRKR